MDKDTAINTCLNSWHYTIRYGCNASASQGLPVLEREVTGDYTVLLKGSNGKYFIEVFTGSGCFYPTVYRVDSTVKPLTEEDII